MFGGIDRDTREYFAVPVERATLLSIIREFILPGTTILNDQWAAYNSIASVPNNYEYQTVNHLFNFVDPEIHLHTENVENIWMRMKRTQKPQMSQHNTLLPTHLDEFMWRRMFDDRPFESVYAICILSCSIFK